MAEKTVIFEETSSNNMCRVTDNEKHHTIDSDEEYNENDKKYDILRDDDIEGQESDPENGFDGEVKLTPFNMKEELQEGHFDKDGTYIFEDDKDAVKDAWIDNIDWVRVKQTEEHQDTEENNYIEKSDDYYENINKLELYEKMIKIMKPGENIFKSLKRLGGNTQKNSASARWLKKKKQLDAKQNDNGDEKLLLELTGYADQLLTNGESEVYQFTYEKISLLIKNLGGEDTLPKAQKPVDEDLDIFSNEDVTIKKQIDKDKPPPTKIAKLENNKDLNIQNDTDQITWEYKLTETDTDLKGPYTTLEMFNWSQEGFFKSEAMCRKVGSNGNFYQISRVDFELYL